MSDKQLQKEALDYHRQVPAGKLEIIATKPMSNSHDLSLAYSPGVAAACEEIVRDPNESFNLTNRGNVVAIISNGTAVLGLGDIGPAAAKPVMEGKAILFKRFSGINGIDIEVDCREVDKFCDIVVALEPSFGGINLEDIKAPECFEIEKRLIERMKIPVFHDDQHGTAIIVTAGLINAMDLIGKKMEEISIVCNGAGAAGISILDMLCSVGAKKENITLCDSKGVIHSERTDINSYKQKYSKKTKLRTLSKALNCSDVFIGVSIAGAVTPSMLKSMNRDPVVFALANPTPEIMPSEAIEIRSDVIMATGRSDFPNQINNVLCFPFLFRGALDVGATTINMEMKIAAAYAIAALAKKEVDESAMNAYEGEDLLFSRSMIIPKPFDIRLIEEISPAVAKAAIDSGVATRPFDSLYSYKNNLRRFVHRSATVMQHVLSKVSTKGTLKRVVYSDGEDSRILNAAQLLINDRIAHPILIGRRRVLEVLVKRLGLRFDLDKDVTIVDPENDPRYKEYHKKYHEIACRDGATPEMAKVLLRTDTTVIASMLLHQGECDTMICGLISNFDNDIEHITQIIGMQPGVSNPIAVNVVLLGNKPLFIADTRVSEDPDSERICEIAKLASGIVENFDLKPKIAMISHSSFGSSQKGSCQKMRKATELLKSRFPDLEVEGEMTPEAALDHEKRKALLTNNSLSGIANLLVMPNLDCANIAYRLARSSTLDGFTIGPIFAGLNKPVSIISKLATVRNIFNLTAVSIKQLKSQDK